MCVVCVCICGAWLCVCVCLCTGVFVCARARVCVGRKSGGDRAEEEERLTPLRDLAGWIARAEPLACKEANGGLS